MPSCCWPVRRLMPCINNFFFFLSSSIPSWQILFIDLTAKGEIAFQEILSHLVEQQTNKYLCQNIASSTCIFLAGRSTSSASLRCAYHVIAAAPPPEIFFFSRTLGQGEIPRVPQLCRVSETLGSRSRDVTGSS